jgi:DNA polymerase I-like protein with 3'-5' exonuclease and polymerase domains
MKDKFSTLNQGTGVYCFDMWIMEWRKKEPQLTAQFHDEACMIIPEGYEKKYEKILRKAVKKVNNKLNLNIKLDIDVQFGKTYADVH